MANKIKRTVLAGLSALVIGTGIIGCSKQNEQYIIDGQPLEVTRTHRIFSDWVSEINFLDTLKIYGDGDAVKGLEYKGLKITPMAFFAGRVSGDWNLVSRTVAMPELSYEEKQIISQIEIKKVQPIYSEFIAKIEHARKQQHDSLYNEFYNKVKLQGERK
jgi:hypothetical protein